MPGQNGPLRLCNCLGVALLSSLELLDVNVPGMPTPGFVFGFRLLVLDRVEVMVRNPKFRLELALIWPTFSG